MIVPFNKSAAAPTPELPKVPEQFLLAAMGQAHAEGKFHVYDPRVAQQFDDAKSAQKQFDQGLGKGRPNTQMEQQYYDDQQTEKDRARVGREGGYDAGDLKAVGKQIEKEQKNTTDSNVEGVEDIELGRWKRKRQDI